MHGAASVVERRTSPGLGRWRLFFRALFLTGPLFGFVRARRPMPPVEELVIPGRRTGAPRAVLLQLIDAPRGLYVIEPSGMPSHWADNLAAARHATVLYADGRRVEVSATELDNGAERDAALKAQPNNQPAPMRVVYRRARRHIAAVGRVFRLERDATQPGISTPIGAPAGGITE
jgi:deazaflavin-dependent oxidoreductase (nitroreductase family)